MTTPYSYSSTVSLQSTATVSSTEPLCKVYTPQKDYAEAFAALQSRYGTGGHVPNPKPKAETTYPSSRTSQQAWRLSMSNNSSTTSTLVQKNNKTRNHLLASVFKKRSST
ncbi:hypothetical protein AMATHDRAFT_53742 [Amanita thiersii Skay4041]|uniref:Uncharacterized protein n=1 Tax=Amanita thiersii Skay4041 TaxID=703135 RepID=A0A2A9P0G9_9AGAR|nr:hypothetical protein AMATHDRAFT_53742 [Amanita thiersii Skay4041]